MARLRPRAVFSPPESSSLWHLYVLERGTSEDTKQNITIHCCVERLRQNLVTNRLNAHTGGEGLTGRSHLPHFRAWLQIQ